MYHISKWYMFHTFHFFHSDATSLILQVNSWAQVVLVNNESWGENISTQTKRCLYKGKTAFLGSLFWSGYPIHVPPKHVSSLPTSCSAFSSLRKTYGRKVFMEGKTRQLQHIKERMQLLFDGFNMLQYDNMVQYGSKSSWFLVLSNWIGLSAFDVNFCLHIVTSLQLWCLFLSRTESHLIDDLFMTSFTACCKWSPWMFKVFDRVTKKRRSPDLLLKQNNAHPISWTIKKATSVWAPLPCRKWWPPEMACETVKLSTLWGFFLGLGSLGECFCWRVVHLTGPLSLHQLPPQNWTILKSACRTFHSPSRCISSRSEQKKAGPWNGTAYGTVPKWAHRTLSYSNNVFWVMSQNQGALTRIPAYKWLYIWNETNHIKNFKNDFLQTFQVRDIWPILSAPITITRRNWFRIWKLLALLAPGSLLEGLLQLAAARREM